MTPLLAGRSIQKEGQITNTSRRSYIYRFVVTVHCFGVRLFVFLLWWRVVQKFESGVGLDWYDTRVQYLSATPPRTPSKTRGERRRLMQEGSFMQHKSIQAGRQQAVFLPHPLWLVASLFGDIIEHRRK